ncbi:MAG: hypothetical protein PHH26_01815 [Candidatus Thermoplasmatota archaeon]|nr:hypothetical protein [Candidatus Thermoplasmatota archaeon]
MMEKSDQHILNAIETSNREILETMAAYATHTDADISSLKSDVGNLKSDVNSLKSDVNSLKSDMQYVKGVINTQMVTKDYLDAQLFKFSGEIGGYLRKEDNKVDVLTGILTKKKVLTKSEAKKITQIGPSFMKV